MREFVRRNYSLVTNSLLLVKYSFVVMDKSSKFC